MGRPVNFEQPSRNITSSARSTNPTVRENDDIVERIASTRRYQMYQMDERRRQILRRPLRRAPEIRGFTAGNETQNNGGTQSQNAQQQPVSPNRADQAGYQILLSLTDAMDNQSLGTVSDRPSVPAIPESWGIEEPSLVPVRPNLAEILASRSELGTNRTEPDSSTDEETKKRAAPQIHEKKGFKRSRLELSSNHVMFLGYDARNFLNEHARTGQKLLPEAQSWAQEYRQHMNMSGDEPVRRTNPETSGFMDRRPREGIGAMFMRRREQIMNRQENENNESEEAPSDEGDVSNVDDEEDSEQARLMEEEREEVEHVRRLEEDVRIEQEIEADYNMRIPNYMYQVPFQRIREALEQLTRILTERLQAHANEGTESLRIHFASEEDLQAEVWRVLNGARPTSPLLIPSEIENIPPGVSVVDE